MKELFNKLFNWMYPPLEIGNNVLYKSRISPNTLGLIKRCNGRLYLIESEIYGSVMTQWIHRRRLRKYERFKLFS